VAKQETPGLGELDGPPAAGALDQALADQCLELVDVVADRGQRAAELLRGRPEGSGLGDRAQRAKMLQLDACPIIRSTDILEVKLLLLRTLMLGTLGSWTSS
jgi:hypothetical protein